MLGRRLLGVLIVVMGIPVMADVPKNVIFVVGDGMGPEQIHAAEIYLNRKISFRQFPAEGSVTTHNIKGTTTDSAAGATAMATGRKVKNGAISQDPKGKPYRTLLEIFRDQGKSTGLVTTTLITDATPAAFGAHAFDRDASDIISSYYFTQTLPNVIMGADEAGVRQKAQNAVVPYKMAHNVNELEALSDLALQKGACTSSDCGHYYAGFGSFPLLLPRITYTKGFPLEINGPEFFEQNALPHLSDMAKAALTILSQNQEGFFLMLECGLIDLVGHNNRLFDQDAKNPSAVEALAAEMSEFDKVAELLAQFVKEHPDTLLVVTADHETGGLVVDENSTPCLGQAGCLANVSWTSRVSRSNSAAHTGVLVGVYALGYHAERFSGQMDNTGFLKKILDP